MKTPAFDRIAREGLRFQNAYTPMAKCAPSRAIVLTGRHLWQNEEAGNHLAMFPPKLKSWPEVLMEKGWHVAITGKGWAPGIANDANGKPRLITGRRFDQRTAQPATGAMSRLDYACHDSNHVPLAVRWARGIRNPGRVIEDFVDFTDIAPTIPDYAGIAWKDSGMMPITGKSWRSIGESMKAGRIVPESDHVLIGKERTDVRRPNNWGYPIRGIVTVDHHYLRNHEPTRWPTGNPETGYLDTDGSPRSGASSSAAKIACLMSPSS